MPLNADDARQLVNELTDLAPVLQSADNAAQKKGSSPNSGE